MLNSVCSARDAHSRPSTTSVTSAQPWVVLASFAKRLAKPVFNVADAVFLETVFTAAAVEKQ